MHSGSIRLAASEVGGRGSMVKDGGDDERSQRRMGVRDDG